MIDIVIAIFVFVIGLCIGSFAACTYGRIRAGKSWHDVLITPSHCDACGENLKPWHNIPIVSFLLQNGRCLFCGAKIPDALPLVELVFGITSLMIWGLIRMFV